MEGKMEYNEDSYKLKGLALDIILDSEVVEEFQDYMFIRVDRHIWSEFWEYENVLNPTGMGKETPTDIDDMFEYIRGEDTHIEDDL